MESMAAFYKSLMQYVIEMADVTILTNSPYLIKPNDYITEFFHQATGDEFADLRLELCPVDLLPNVSDVRFKEDRRTYVGAGESAGTYFTAHPKLPPYAFVSRSTVKDGYLRCEYIPGNEEHMDYARNLLTLMDIEATLLDFGALILHASLIRLGRQSVIFSAPSGTGKSTQAELWEQYEGAEILNGDRAALRQIDGIWKAYGLPYAGTSGIYRNESAPLSAIVALRQAQENRIRRITGAEAFCYLYPETMIHRWDPAFERRASDLLLSLIGDMPVFLLECRPDRTAVELLRDTIEATASIDRTSGKETIS